MTMIGTRSRRTAMSETALSQFKPGHLRQCPCFGYQALGDQRLDGGRGLGVIVEHRDWEGLEAEGGETLRILDHVLYELEGLGCVHSAQGDGDAEDYRSACG